MWRIMPRHVTCVNVSPDLRHHERSVASPTTRTRRHGRDPTVPSARSVPRPAQGASATVVTVSALLFRTVHGSRRANAGHYLGLLQRLIAMSSTKPFPGCVIRVHTGRQAPFPGSVSGDGMVASAHRGPCCSHVLARARMYPAWEQRGTSDTSKNQPSWGRDALIVAQRGRAFARADTVRHTGPVRRDDGKIWSCVRYLATVRRAMRWPCSRRFRAI